MKIWEKVSFLEIELNETNKKYSKEKEDKRVFVDLREKLIHQVKELELKVKFLEEKNDKSLRIMAQSEKLENILSMRKFKGDSTGISYGTHTSKPNKSFPKKVGPKYVSNNGKHPIQMDKNNLGQKNSNRNVLSWNSHVKCYYCGMLGHLKFECQKKRNDWLKIQKPKQKAKKKQNEKIKKTNPIAIKQIWVKVSDLQNLNYNVQMLLLC